MARGSTLIVCLVAVSLTSMTSLRAQTPTTPDKAPPTSSTPGAQIFLKHLKIDSPVDGYLDNLQKEFFQLDADSNNKLNEADIALHESVSAARSRATAAGTYMGYDLNGDGMVTEDEVRTAIRYMSRARLGAIQKLERPRGLASIIAQEDAAVRDFRNLDADKDGKLNYLEASSFRLNVPTGTASLPELIRQALGSQDGKLNEITLADFVASGEAFFRTLDTDSDGRISQQELMAFWSGKTLDKSKAPVLHTPRSPDVGTSMQAGCSMPAPSDKAKLIVLSAYETQALSSVAIGSQEAVIHAGHIAIEAGEDPLYVVIPTYSGVIWQFSGAVDRVERLVLTSAIIPSRDTSNGPPLVGATGLAADRISFFPQRGCFNFFSDLKKQESASTLKTIENRLGRELTTAAAAYAVIGFSIPSGKIETIKNRYNGKVVVEGSGITIKGDTSNVIERAGPSSAKQELYRFSPAGVVSIDATTVVSSRPARPYVVLPQQAGLVQLLEEGALKEQGRAFVIQKKMRFPAGLHGAHSVKFVLPRGIEPPEGDPGHSCVTVEGSPSSDPRC